MVHLSVQGLRCKAEPILDQLRLNALSDGSSDWYQAWQSQTWVTCVQVHYLRHSKTYAVDVTSIISQQS